MSVLSAIRDWIFSAGDRLAAYIDRHNLEEWKKAATRMGLAFDVERRSIVGNKLGCDVLVEIGPPNALVVHVTLTGPLIPRPIQLQTMDVAMAMPGRFLSGDLEFDRRFIVTGDHLYAHAVFHDELCAKLVRANAQWAASVNRNVLYGVCPTNPADVAETIDTLAWIAASLSIPDQEIAPRLVLKLTRSESAAVRNKLFDEIIASRRVDLKKLAMDTCRDHPDPWLRMRVAVRSGIEGYPTLRAIVLDSSVEDSARARAFELLIQLKTTLLLPPLDPKGAFGPKLLGALILGLPDGEKQVIELLEVGDDGTRRAAIEALGEAGGTESISVLAPMIEGGGLPVLRAVEKLRARAGAAPGRLSLVEASGGELSVSHEKGALSVADEDQ